jgi:hypothetical protein
MAQPALPLPAPLPASLVALLQGATDEQRAALAQTLQSPEMTVALAAELRRRPGVTLREAFKRRLSELAAQIEGVTALYLAPDLHEIFFFGPVRERSIVDRCHAAAVQAQNELTPGEPHRLISMFTSRNAEGLQEKGYERVELHP